MSSSEENFDLDNVSGSESEDYAPAPKKVWIPLAFFPCRSIYVTAVLDQGIYEEACIQGSNLQGIYLQGYQSKGPCKTQGIFQEGPYGY
jgi:hypothetical protein